MPANDSANSCSRISFAVTLDALTYFLFITAIFYCSYWYILSHNRKSANRRLFFTGFNQFVRNAEE